MKFAVTFALPGPHHYRARPQKPEILVLVDMRKSWTELAGRAEYFLERLPRDPPQIVLLVGPYPGKHDIIRQIMQASVTSLIARLRDGDRSALDQLMPMVYSELHKIATGYLKDESGSHTLQPTALVHEAYIRLLGADHPEYANRAHFFGVAANLMRQILVDHARARQAAKRGGGALSLVIDDRLDGAPARAPTIVALDDALRALARTDENKARLVELRFFGGMTAEEIAEFLHDSVHRVRHEMRLAVAWLHREVTR